MNFTLPLDAWVLVCDGSKAVFYKNVGSARQNRLKAEQTLEEHHPATHVLGTDRPGRSVDANDGSRSAVETTDFHQQAEAEFLKQVARALEPIAAKGAHIVIAAPPRALGILRDHLGPASHQALRAELAKDLVKMPTAKIASYLQSVAG